MAGAFHSTYIARRLLDRFLLLLIHVQQCHVFFFPCQLERTGRVTYLGHLKSLAGHRFGLIGHDAIAISIEGISTGFDILGV